MSDDKSKLGPADRIRIDMHADCEARQLVGRFGVSKEEPAHAVQAVGPMA